MRLVFNNQKETFLVMEPGKIDQQSCSKAQLYSMAGRLDNQFYLNPLKSVGWAANILRRNGYIVKEL